MNVMRFAVATAAAALLSPAFAQNDAAPPEPGLTRADVIAQLKQAYLDGDLPTTDGDYPPSDRTRARNRELIQAAHPAWLDRAPQAVSQQQ
ncbi:DUF4148 domain-containing protein [Burkholderia pseudomultivorans]|uniref:DUF4148 domain-containing protein n=1 Tax=Burkholderia pseudomultivorans TaxID=1207504 RepID=UPI00075E15B5|nr:DUF4148 domain-containing protein [Burkholderia pseudomultivorans]KWI61731.1 hypothetical protein WT72_05340 [Burkholderia pseudomultivorans]MBF5013783.1 DUF4148 domain-containing protein [Burkholderia pseudomultivorans]